MAPHRPLLLDIGRAPDCCSNDAIELLHKATAEEPDGSDPWAPHYSPFIRALIERFTKAGLDRIAEASAELQAWLDGARREVGGRLERPRLEAWRLSEHELALVRIYLAHLPLDQWTLEDYGLLVDYLVQRYLPIGVLRTEAEALAVQSNLMGRVQAQLGTLDADHAGQLAAALPSTAFAARASFEFTSAASAILDYGILRCCEQVAGLADAVRHRVKWTVLEHQSQVLAGTLPAQPLTAKLFDAFGTANLDWRRIALTEAGEMANQGFVSALQPDSRVRRLEAYSGACAFCRRLDGRIFNVKRADDADKDGERDIWPGKTNQGRSAAAFKRVGGMLVERPASERWWPAAGTQHPHCRGTWHVEAGMPAGGSPKFQAWLETHLAQGRQAPEAGA